MGQRKIHIELTETQARAVRWALHRATMVEPRSTRNSPGWKKMLEAQARVLEATEGLPDLIIGPGARLNR